MKNQKNNDDGANAPDSSKCDGRYQGYAPPLSPKNIIYEDDGANAPNSSKWDGRHQGHSPEIFVTR